MAKCIVHVNKFLNFEFFELARLLFISLFHVLLLHDLFYANRLMKRAISPPKISFTPSTARTLTKSLSHKIHYRLCTINVEIFHLYTIRFKVRKGCGDKCDLNIYEAGTRRLAFRLQNEAYFYRRQQLRIICGPGGNLNCE